MKRLALGLGLLTGMAGAAFAQGCEIEGGESEPMIEAFNQLILEQKFDAFAAEMQAKANMNVSGAMESVASAYAAGFTGCATIAQRRDVGGLTQHLVLFKGKAGPLFVYWLYAGAGEDTVLLQFKLDSDLEILEKLR